MQLPVETVLVRVPVVVGQREQQEVEEVVLDHVAGHAAGVAIANAGHAQGGAAGGAARGEDVRVEELARPHHRMAHERGHDPRQRGVALRLVAVAAAVHEVRGARGAHIGVVEALEHGERVLGEVCAVHVVDGVRELARDPEALGCAKARAVLDVAMLLAVEPVHRGYLMRILALASHDRSCAHRRHGGEGGDAVGHVLPTLDELREHGRGAHRDRALQHRGRERIYHAQHELGRRGPLDGLHQRRMTRKPAYFAPARARTRSSSNTASAAAR